LTARFDDLTTGDALAFSTPDRVLTTRQASQAPAILEEVDRATEEGGWAYGFVAYEAAQGFDPKLAVARPAATGPPLVWFGISERRPYRARPLPCERADASWKPDWSAAEHALAVARIREYIAAGESYQCNLTTRLRAAFTGEPLALYANLALAQRAAYNAYLSTDRFAIASASPELFIEWSGDRLRSRPMKGTAPRGDDPAEDERNAHGLRNSPKERAENVMIVDLIRNDMARVAATGSVEVPRLLTVEQYPTLWTMTSEVTARLRAGTGLADIFKAMFPCGSITGAPKARSMEIIREVEAGPRGVYCGAIGWVAPPSEPVRARFSVAIRTAVIDRVLSTATYGAGGGITWGSKPDDEWAEVLTKTAILTRILETVP
jgi:para-aminobenzoate synthetase/4-amino-4-deoxychorismate lyase